MIFGKLSGVAVFAAFSGLLMTSASSKSDPAVERPKITGVANVGFFVSDQAKSEEFFGHVLGLEHFDQDRGSEGPVRYYGVNSHQYVEIYPGLKGDQQDRLSHVAFETTDARKMRDYLATKGVHVPDL